MLNLSSYLVYFIADVDFEIPTRQRGRILVHCSTDLLIQSSRKQPNGKTMPTRKAYHEIINAQCEGEH